MAEAGASDATIMAVAGHVDRAMMEHYSHVRMAAKRDVLQKLESGLMEIPVAEDVTERPVDPENGLRHNPRRKTARAGDPRFVTD
jgi:hypothetical protein